MPERLTRAQLLAEGIVMPNLTPPKPRVVINVGTVSYRVLYTRPLTADAVAALERAGAERRREARDV